VQHTGQSRGATQVVMQHWRMIAACADVHATSHEPASVVHPGVPRSRPDQHILCLPFKVQNVLPTLLYAWQC
jgi:hypothetical protein